jgi:hypothetical protein
LYFRFGIVDITSNYSHSLSLTDGQTQVEIKVHQGEREMARDNKLLGNYSHSLSLTDGQTQVEIKVHQGEREMARDNKLLGNYHILSNSSCMGLFGCVVDRRNQCCGSVMFIPRITDPSFFIPDAGFRVKNIPDPHKRI